MDSEKTVTAVFRFDSSHDGNTYTDAVYGSNNGSYYIGLFNRTEIVLRTITYSGGTLHFYSDRYYYGNLNDADIHAPLFGCTDNTFTNCTDYNDMVDFGVSNVIHSTYDFGLNVPVDFPPATPLAFPLNGLLANRTILSSFGDDWLESCGGQVKKHAGIDINADENETVYAAESGIVKVAQTDQSWGGWVTIEHGGSYTTVYWHITPSVSVNDTVTKGDPIGTVVDYGGPLHLHFGLREGAYSNTSNRGALPQSTCGGDPAFSDNFVDPETLSFE